MNRQELEEIITQAGNAQGRAMLRVMVSSGELGPLARTILKLAGEVKELQEGYPRIKDFTTQKEYIQACLEYEKKLR